MLAAKKALPKGDLDHFVTEVQGRVDKFEEENKFGGLTEKEI